MKRRRVDPAQQVPARLRHYVPEHWPAPTGLDGFHDWRDARRTYDAAHGWPFGSLNRIREEYVTRRRLLGHTR